MDRYVFSYQDIVKESWEALKKHYGMIVGLFLFVWMILTAFFLLVGMTQNAAPGLSFLLSLALTGLGAFLSLGMIRCMLRIVDHQPVEFNLIFSGGDVFAVFLLGSLLYSLVVFIGMLVFIIPGIYLSLKYSCVHYLIADKGCGVAEAFKISGRITSGYKRHLFALGFLAGAFNFLGMMLFGVGILLTVPLTILFFPIAYRKLMAASSQDEVENDSIPDHQSTGLLK